MNAVRTPFEDAQGQPLVRRPVHMPAWVPMPPCVQAASEETAGAQWLIAVVTAVLLFVLHLARFAMGMGTVHSEYEALVLLCAAVGIGSFVYEMWRCRRNAAMAYLVAFLLLANVVIPFLWLEPVPDMHDEPDDPDMVITVDQPSPYA